MPGSPFHSGAPATTSRGIICSTISIEALIMVMVTDTDMEMAIRITSRIISETARLEKRLPSIPLKDAKEELWELRRLPQEDLVQRKPETQPARFMKEAVNGAALKLLPFRIPAAKTELRVSGRTVGVMRDRLTADKPVLPVRIIEAVSGRLRMMAGLTEHPVKRAFPGRSVGPKV